MQCITGTLQLFIQILFTGTLFLFLLFKIFVGRWMGTENMWKRHCTFVPHSLDPLSRSRLPYVPTGGSLSILQHFTSRHGYSLHKMISNKFVNGLFNTKLSLNNTQPLNPLNCPGTVMSRLLTSFAGEIVPGNIDQAAAFNWKETKLRNVSCFARNRRLNFANAKRLRNFPLTLYVTRL